MRIMRPLFTAYVDVPMPLIRLDNASLHFGLQVILDGVQLLVEPSQRLCLIGHNGAGKSTLMKIISGDVLLDGGEIWRQPGLKLARLEQDLPEPDALTVYEVVSKAFDRVGDLVTQYHKLAIDPNPDMKRLGQLQAQIEAEDGWAIAQKVESILTRLELPSDATMASLSGGWRRRVALAKALVIEPDLLMLDEPTNHLDIEAIEWLEKQILAFRGAVVFVTHDRALLQKLATHIVELDRGFLRSWTGDYQSFLVFREQQIAEQERHNALFDKRLAEEEVWIRQGIKARRTRNEGRVRALKALRVERAQRRERHGQASFELQQSENSGKLVAELKGVSQGWGGRAVISNFSTTIIRGDRIGFLGPNGAGKSTLLKIILGQLQPDEGSVRLGTNINVAYFDQLRDQLDLEKNVVDNIAEGREFIDVNGKQKHIISYLSDFLFTGERARTPLKALSGGERNRVLLARLFSKPANLLVLDEPTNDLDVETLELLEELLSAYQGTMLLVSHDRSFLDNVVTSCFAFEGAGRVNEYVGGFEDWQRQGGQWHRYQESTSSSQRDGESTVAAAAKGDSSASGKSKKLSYKLQRELEQLPLQIEQLEKDIAALQDQIAKPDFFEQERHRADSVLAKLAELESSLEVAFERWAELDAM